MTLGRVVVEQVSRARSAALVALTTLACLIGGQPPSHAVPTPSVPTNSVSEVPAAAGVSGETPTPAPVAPTAPKPPTAAEVAAGAAAQRAKDAADQHVATLAGKIARESKQLAALSTTASLAEQHFTLQQAVQAQATLVEALAELHLRVVLGRYRAAHDALIAIAVSSYQSDGAPGSLSTSSVASLLTEADPGAVLSSATAQRMLGDHQVGVVAQLSAAVHAVASARQDQQSALAAVAQQTARLNAIRRRAETALATSRREVSGLQADLVKAKVGQKQADAALSTFLGGWSLADPARAGALNKQYEAVALAGSHVKPAPPSATWTAAMGQTVVTRALQYLGTDYAWAGGDADGPTTGTCAGGGAQNDCHLTGFDCSGLAMYAWAPYLGLPHNAAAQYNFGTLHPAPTALLPGDLVFWSSNHAASGIHHVAIYVGNGNVIQAPESGDIVRITPLGNVSTGYFGATRPLS